MNNQPLVSIIIPTYNRANLIGETLDSIISQTYKNWECIVVDDGSSDYTNEVMQAYVEKDSRIKYYHRPKEHLPGGNGARNFGFKMSKGDYVQWFDSDDLMRFNFLEMKILNFTPSINYIICEGWYFYENSPNKRIRITNNEFIYKAYVLWKTSIFTPSILFKKEYLIDKSLFDETILKGQESEFFSRLFYETSSKEFKLLNTPLFYYRRHSNTKSELDKAYISAFKFSTAKNHMVNLKRGIELQDEELTKYFYKKNLKIYYSACQNNDKSTISFILLEFKNNI